jgi:hypothetical protein
MQPRVCSAGTGDGQRTLPVRFWIAGVRSREAGMWVPLDANGTASVALPF